MAADKWRSSQEVLSLLRDHPRDIFYGELSDDEPDCEQVEYEEVNVQDAYKDPDFNPQFHARNENDDELETEEKNSWPGRRRSIIRGKNNYKWYSRAPEMRGRRSCKAYLPSAKFEAKDATILLQIWSLLFSAYIVNIIARYTNEEIARKLENALK